MSFDFEADLPIGHLCPLQRARNTNDYLEIANNSHGGWSGAGLGIEMLRGSLVYWFIGFWLLGFKLSKFLGFKFSKIYQSSISCILGYIDPISENLKFLLDGSSGLFGAPLCQQKSKCWFLPISRFINNNMFINGLDTFLGIFRDFWWL